MNESDIEMVVLGTRPFLLIEVEGVNEDGGIEMDIKGGGGVLEQDIPYILALVAEGLELDAFGPIPNAD